MARKFEKKWLLPVSGDVSFYSEIKRTLPKVNSYHLMELIVAYNEQWRWYHNQEHILQMLGYAAPATFPGGDELTEEERRALRAMIIFHDVVYKLSREPGWNERESAEYAKSVLQTAKESTEFIELVVVGIIATTDHTLKSVPAEHHHVVKWLLDIDMFVGLGVSKEEFTNNSILIGMEYSPCHTTPEYQKGRKVWAEGMLAKEHIYLTDHFQKYEVVARESLRLLTHGTP